MMTGIAIDAATAMPEQIALALGSVVLAAAAAFLVYIHIDARQGGG